MINLRGDVSLKPGGGGRGDLIDVSLKGNGGENLETVSIGSSFEDLCFKEKQKMGVVSAGQID